MVDPIYGHPGSWYTLSNSFSKIKAANFTNNAASLDNARIAFAMQAGTISPGSLLEGSVCTHAIPATLSDHPWNTMFDVGGVNAKGGPDNCILHKHFGPSPGIIYRANSRSSGSSSASVFPSVNSSQLYNSPNTNVYDNWDVYRFCPLTAIDFKRFVFAIVLQVCNDFTYTPDAEGINQVSGSVTSKMIDLQSWINSDHYHSEYPHICNVLLVPMFQMSGSTETWNNFSPSVTADHRLSCIPNMNFDYTCAAWDNSTSRVSKNNAPGTILSNAVSWMDNMPISSSNIVYSVTESTYDTLLIGESPATLFNLFGMLGGNGTSEGISAQNYISSYNDRYQVRTVRGYSHLDIFYTSTSSDTRSIFAVWKDQPEYPTPVDPEHITPVELLAIEAWKASIKSCIHHMVAYTGAVYQDSVYGYNQNPSVRYIGVIDERGYATGDFEQITETDLENYPQTASDDFIADTPYDPASETDPNTYTDVMPSSLPPSVRSCNKYYAVDDSNLGILYSALTQTLDGVPTGEKEEYLLSHFLTTNPGDLIVSLKWYPFDFADLFFDTTDTPKIIFIGDLPLEYNSANVVGYKAKQGSSFSLTVKIGSFKLFRRYGDFRDFSPYTSCEIYIPFCSPVSLDLSVCMDHMIYVQLSIDLLTGAVTSMIRLDTSDGIITATSSGSCGVDLPVTSLDQAAYNNATFGAIQTARNATDQLESQYLGAVTSGIMTAMGAGMGKAPQMSQAVQAGTQAVSNTSGILRAWDTKIAADYQLSHIPEHYKRISAVTSSLSMLLPLSTYAIIERPQMLPGDHSQYGHTVGYATLFNGRLGDLSGYTICQTADLSGFTAPSSVKDMIYQALRSGVYV